jgi:hypothetical protein
VRGTWVGCLLLQTQGLLLLLLLLLLTRTRCSQPCAGVQQCHGAGILWLPLLGCGCCPWAMPLPLALALLLLLLLVIAAAVAQPTLPDLQEVLQVPLSTHTPACPLECCGHPAAPPLPAQG